MFTWILSDAPAAAQQLRQLMAQAGHHCPAENLLQMEQLPHLMGAEPDQQSLLLLTLSPDPSAGLEALHQLRAQLNCSVIVVGPRDPCLILESMRAGADDYVDEADALEFELLTALQRRAARQGGQRISHGKLIAVTGANGGSGRTVAAVNLSILLAKAQGRSCLVDLDPGGGACASMLNLTGPQTILDLCQFSDKLDRHMLEQSLVLHESGVSVLPGAGEIVPASLFEGELIDRVVSAARTLFPSVVIDLHNLADEVLVKRLLAHDVTLALVTRLDFNSICSTGRTLEYWDRCGLSRKRIILVANRRGQPGEMPLKEVEQALALRIQHFLPDDPALVNRSINHGIPLVMDEPHAPLAKSLTELSLTLLGDAAVRSASPERTRESLFSPQRLASLLSRLT